MTVFVDTSALYALLDEDDQNHRLAAALWAELVPGEDLLTHAYVVVETSALVQRRLGMAAVDQLHDGLLAPVRVLTIDDRTHRLAVTQWRSGGLRGISLVDAISFVVMAESEVDLALAFDEDFTRSGFRLVDQPRE